MLKPPREVALFAVSGIGGLMIDAAVINYEVYVLLLLSFSGLHRGGCCGFGSRRAGQFFDSPRSAFQAPQYVGISC